MQARVQDIGEMTEPFPVSNGVKQGCVLAPTLFSLMFSAMLTDAFRDGDVGIVVRYRTDGTLFNLRWLQAKTKVMTDITGDFCWPTTAPSTLSQKLRSIAAYKCKVLHIGKDNPDRMT